MYGFSHDVCSRRFLGYTRISGYEFGSHIKPHLDKLRPVKLSYDTTGFKFQESEGLVFFRLMYVFFCVRDVKERKMFKTFNISRLFFVCAFQRFLQIPFIKCWRLLSKKAKRPSNQCHPLEWNLMASAGVPVMRMDLTWSLEIRLPELVRLKRNKLKQTTLSNLKRRETTKHDAHYVTIYILSIQTYVSLQSVSMYYEYD